MAIPDTRKSIMRQEGENPMRKNFAYLLLFLLCFSVLAGCTEYGTKAVESITDTEFKATYESYNKTVSKKIPSIPDSILAIQVQELQFKEGKVTITVTDPKGKQAFEQVFEPGTHQDGYAINLDQKGEYEMKFAFEHVKDGKHLITWETD
ncbi:hypothetical protein AM501_17910 [Aneurinibacillus migulanus]|nr:hypothetical protein TS64_26360 [Aneurinibacillus migulanus]KPD07062.1 hypothetical protein AM501_17910 [Aneurinibacillus migulanus]CEH31830.1 Uncharacterized protein BN1090_A2_04321 [Aneurinibacillus migulanus]